MKSKQSLAKDLLTDQAVEFRETTDPHRAFMQLKMMSRGIDSL
jgi:hypothetical protein